MHVLIAGVAGITGRLLAETLITAPSITRVTGLDPRLCLPPLASPDPERWQFVRARFRQPEWTPLLDDVDTVIHLTGVEWPAPRRQSPDGTLFEDARFVLDTALAAGVRQLIVVTNAALYGTSPPDRRRLQRPDAYLGESAPVRGHGSSAYARARARIADYLDVIAARNTDRVITRLRTAWLCGARHTALVRYAQTEPVLVHGLADHTLDVIHEQDAIAAIVLALHHDLPGVYHVGYGADAGDPLTFRALATLTGQDRDPVSLARVVLRAWWRWRWRGKATPPGWVRDLYRARLLAAQPLHAAGWQPQYTAHEAVREAVEAIDV